MPEGLVDVSGRDEISRLRAACRSRASPRMCARSPRTNHRETGFAPLSVNPDTARRFAAYFGGLFDPKAGRLPIRERELIAVVVSSANGCGLCEIHHTLALGDALGDAAKARRIALDHHLAPLTPREHALVDFAAKVTTAPKSIGPGDFDRLRSVGLDDADIPRGDRDERLVQSHQPHLHLARRRPRRQVLCRLTPALHSRNPGDADVRPCRRGRECHPSRRGRRAALTPRRAGGSRSSRACESDLRQVPQP